MKNEYEVRDVKIVLSDDFGVVRWIFDHDLGYFVPVKSESEDETSES